MSTSPQEPQVSENIRVDVSSISTSQLKRSGRCNDLCLQRRGLGRFLVLGFLQRKASLSVNGVSQCQCEAGWQRLNRPVQWASGVEDEKGGQFST